MKPGSDMSCAAASSLIGRLPAASSPSTARRVRSESAAKSVSRASSEYLTIGFSISPARHGVNPTNEKAGLRRPCSTPRRT